jgi:hypothetical protein
MQYKGSHCPEWPMSPLWLFNGNYPTCDCLLSSTSPNYLQTPTWPGHQSFPPETWEKVSSSWRTISPHCTRKYDPEVVLEDWDPTLLTDMTVHFNRPDLTLVDGMNKKNIAHIRNWRLKSTNSGKRTRLLLFHWSCLLWGSSLTCLTKDSLPSLHRHTTVPGLASGRAKLLFHRAEITYWWRGW